MDKLVIKFTRKLSRPRIGKRILKKKNKIGGFVLLNVKTNYKVVVTKTV